MNTDEILKKTKEALAEAVRQKRLTEDFVKSLGPAIIDALAPVIAEMGKNASMTKKDILDAVAQIKVSSPDVQVPSFPAFPEIVVPEPKVTVNVPAIKIPEIKLPTINIPKIFVPEIKIPPFKFPDFPKIEMPETMKILGDVRLLGFDYKNPLPVRLVDLNGRPYESMGSQTIGGGRGDFFTIKDIQNSAGGSIIDNDGNLKVAGSFSVVASNASSQAIDSSGNVYNQANPFPVTVVSGGTATTGSALVDSSGVQYSGSNPLPVSASLSPFATYYASDAVGSVNLIQINGNAPSTGINETDLGTLRMTIMTDTISSINIVTFNGNVPSQGKNETNAGVLRTVLMSDTVNSVYANNPSGQGDSATALRVVLANDVAYSVNVNGFSNSVAASLVDSSGVGYSGSNPLPITGPVVVTSITNTVAAALVDSSGVEYSGSNPLPTSTSLSVPQGQGDAATAMRVVVAGNSDMSTVINAINGPIAQGDSASALRVVQAGDAASSINVNQINGNTIVVGTGYQDNAIRVVHATDAVVSVNIVSGSSSGVTGQGDGASALRTIQAGDTVSSVYVNNPVAQGDSATALRVTQAGDVASSINLLTINGNTPATGLNETNSGVIRVVQMTDSNNSVNVTQFNGVAPATGLNETNAGVLRTVQMSDNINSANVVSFNGNAPATGLNETSAGVLRTVLMSDTVYSMYAQNPIGQGDSTTALRVVQAGDVVVSVNIVSGSSSGVTGPGEGATALRIIQAGDTVSSMNLLQINGNAPATGLNETNAGVLRTVLMSDTVYSVYAQNPIAQGDSATALRVVQAGDVAVSVFVTGFADSMTTYMARSTNPTAKSDGADVRPTADLLGRAVMKPHQVRDLISTAYVTLTNGSETTLLAASAGNKFDLLYIMGANTSGAAVQVDIRPVTGGNIITTLMIPAGGTAGVVLPVAYPIADSGNNWTADMPDITNSNVILTALFSKET